MTTVWKVLLGLALVVPLGAYVAGSLVASASDDPAPRHAITTRESDPRGSASPTPSPTPSPTRSTEPEVITPGHDDLEDDGDDQGDDQGDDHEGENHGGPVGGEDGGDDHTGHGGGED